MIALGVTLPQRPSVRNLRPLTEDNGIRTTKTVDMIVHQDKTIEELKKALAAAGFAFEHRNYGLPELEELCSLRNTTTNVTHPRILEGWCGRPKGLLQILYERGMINPAVPLRQYKKN